MVSKSSIRHAIYDVLVDLAHPGDVCFFITENYNCYNNLTRFQKTNRKWVGFSKNDISILHLGILSKFEKKPKSSQIRPYMIHSTKEKGVIEEHIQPEYFTSENIELGTTVCRTIMEILRYQDLSNEQNKNLVEFCRKQIGKPFPKSITGESLTYWFGLPNFFNNQSTFSCHSLVFSAFASIGVNFPHHLEHSPIFNLARYIGHPIKHHKDSVNPNFAYLRDQHLYRDPRFIGIVSITYDEKSHEIHFIENPLKYSWNPELAQIYGLNGYKQKIIENRREAYF